MPSGHFHVVQTAVVDTGHEAIPEFRPLRIAVCRIERVFGIGIDPVLEGIHHRHVGPEQDNAFQMLDTCPRRLFLVVETARIPRKVWCAKQFHRHRCDFGKLGRHFNPLVAWKIDTFKHVKCVTAFMQKSLHVIMQTNRVHENEGAFSVIETCAVTAGRFAFAVIEIEQSFALHDRVVAAKLRIDAVEDGRHLFNQHLYIVERFQRRTPQRINVGVPRAQRRNPKPRPALLVNTGRRRNHHLFDSTVKVQTVVRGIVKAQQGTPYIRAIIRHISIGGDFATQCQEPLPQVIQRLSIGKLAFDGQPPCPLTDRAIRFQQHGTHLWNGAFFPFPFDGLGGDDLVIFSPQLVLFGEQRHVFVAE